MTGISQYDAPEAKTNDEEVVQKWAIAWLVGT